MRDQSEIEDRYLKLAITLKTNELKRNQLSSLTYHHVESAILAQWKFEKPNTIHEAIHEIMQLNANEVVAYLSTQALILGSKMAIQDFDDLIGGDR